MNPAGSVKDRAALNIFREAGAAGKLGGRPSSKAAGNTGIGLAAVAATRGVRCVVSSRRRRRRRRRLFELGARVVEVPAAPVETTMKVSETTGRR